MQLAMQQLYKWDRQLNMNYLKSKRLNFIIENINQARQSPCYQAIVCPLSYLLYYLYLHMIWFPHPICVHFYNAAHMNLYHNSLLVEFGWKKEVWYPKFWFWTPIHYFMSMWIPHLQNSFPNVRNIFSNFVWILCRTPCRENVCKKRIDIVRKPSKH